MINSAKRRYLNSDLLAISYDLSYRIVVNSLVLLQKCSWSISLIQLDEKIFLSKVNKVKIKPYDEINKKIFFDSVIIYNFFGVYGV